MKTSKFTYYAWFVVGYNILVILWGAVVRATGSGAGCGNHWPSCDGAVIPRPEDIETIIEFSHRLTSGLAGVFVLVLVGWAFANKVLPRFTRRMAIAALVFVILEGAIGAMLVRLDLVGDNASVARAVVIALHLANTFLLLESLVLTAWSSATGKRLSLRESGLPQSRLTLLMIALVMTVFLSSAGAITALGDTLFPAESLVEGLRQDLDPLANFLIRLRVIHPIIAILTSIYLLGIGSTFANPDNPGHSPTARRYVRWMYGIVIVQVIGGFINVALLAPVWMQVIHLLLADSLWITLVLIAAELLGVAEKTKTA